MAQIPKQQVRTSLIQGNLPTQTPLYDLDSNSTPATWVRYLVDLDKFVTSAKQFQYQEGTTTGPGTESPLYCTIGCLVAVQYTNTTTGAVVLTLPEYPAQVTFLSMVQGTSIAPLWLSTSSLKITVPSGASVNGSYLKRLSNINNRSQ